MSKYEQVKRTSIATIRKATEEGRKISMVTCYDAAFSKLIAKTEIDIILVGDSLGNVMLGFPNTLPVTMEHMLHHTAAVSRVNPKQFICGDMPFMSYHVSAEQALTNAGKFIAQAGAHCVKLEGGKAVIPQVKKLVENGIPVIGHLGLTPQSINSLGGYFIQGRDQDKAGLILEDAQRLEDAGAFALVLEMVPSELAKTISERLKIPTIGIGAGPHCDGQVLVLHDLLGFDADFNPKFLKKFANLGATIEAALSAYDHDVKGQEFPGKEHSF